MALDLAKEQKAKEAREATERTAAQASRQRSSRLAGEAEKHMEGDANIVTKVNKMPEDCKTRLQLDLHAKSMGWVKWI